MKIIMENNAPFSDSGSVFSDEDLYEEMGNGVNHMFPSSHDKIVNDDKINGHLNDIVMKDCCVNNKCDLENDNLSKDEFESCGSSEDVEDNMKNRLEESDEVFSDGDVITDFLDKCNTEAEARLAARRQARAEAREIRMRELERQQREQEENADRVYDMYTDPVTRNTATTRLVSGVSGRASMMSNSSYHSSRRSSEDSLEDSGNLRDLRLEIRELEEKFRKAMITNAQLDNDKASYTYQIELLKDRLEEIEQDHSQLQREHRDKCREHEQLKRATAKLKDDFTCVKTLLEERDRLITEAGLVIVQCEDDSILDDDENGGGDNNINHAPKKVLVSMENAEVLQNIGEGSLDVRLKKFLEEKKDLEDQIRSLRLELDEERNKSRRNRPNSNLSINTNSISMNGPDSELIDNADVLDIQRETNKQLADYKFKLQKADQDIASLQAAVARLESQVIRYKAAAEASEKAEDELKVEKRKLQREARESQSRVEELETANSHLQKRLDKLKNAKSALLKDI